MVFINLFNETDILRTMLNMLMLYLLNSLYVIYIVDMTSFLSYNIFLE